MSGTYSLPPGGNLIFSTIFWHIQHVNAEGDRLHPKCNLLVVAEEVSCLALLLGQYLTLVLEKILSETVTALGQEMGRQ